MDVATDYAMILLAFTKRGLEQLQFGTLRKGQVGAEDALVLDWRQTTAAAGQLEFRGKQHRPPRLARGLWVRRSDGLPLRIQAWSEHADSKTSHPRRGDHRICRLPHGFLAPASVVHRHIVDGELITENLYRYEPFRLFTAETQIKFTELPDPCYPPLRQKTMTRIVYLHGFASGPASSKARYFKEHLETAGARVDVPDLAAGDFEHLTISGQIK